MDSNNELTGKMVLVHPELQHDPSGKQNQLGIIKYGDVDRDDFYVAFEDDSSGLYAADALLVLKQVDEIHQNLADYGETLLWPELKALTQLDLTLRYGNADKIFKAFQIAIDNPTIQVLSLDTLRDILRTRQINLRKR